MRRILLLVAGLLLMACRDSTAPEREHTFVLRSIGESVVPWALNDSLKVHSGSIVLRPDSTFFDILTYDYVFSGAKHTTTDTLTGRYRVSGAVIALAGVGVGGYNGSEITIVYDRVWRYAK